MKKREKSQKSSIFVSFFFVNFSITHTKVFWIDLFIAWFLSL